MPDLSFERQVAEALAPLMMQNAGGYELGGAESQQVARAIASRVAAAIEAAAWDKDDPPWVISAVRRAAGLRVLRGDP